MSSSLCLETNVYAAQHHPSFLPQFLLNENRILPTFLTLFKLNNPPTINLRVVPADMASEDQDNASNGNSLADRISKPEPTPANAMSAAATAFQPKSGKLWSDETESPVTPTAQAPPQPQTTEKAPTETPPAEPSQPPNMPQVDGATTPFNGSDLQESEYSVQIKLADMQADPNNPLYSVSTFEELNL